MLIDIKYCGICHTDLPFVKNDLGNTHYPLAPGHEITGLVERVGSAVTRYKPGERVGVGCLVDSCRRCALCQHDEEQFCPEVTFTYGGVGHDGAPTQGGYATKILS